jgi:hypothetical protein
MIPLLVVLAGVVAQAPPLRVELRGIRGSDTITPEVEKLRLPPGTPSEAKLLGVFDWDQDGSAEIFAGWTAPAGSDTEFDNHVIVLRRAGEGSQLLQHVTIRGERLLELWFYRPRDRRDTPKVVALLLGGATWSTVYQLRPGVDRAEELFGMNDHEFADLNGDGISELIGWNRRPDDLRCGFGFFGVRVNPQVFVESGKQFHKVWPLAGPWFQVMADFVELDRQGTVGMIALEDNARMQPGSQRLALYRMEGEQFRLLSAIDCPWPSIAVLFEIRKGERRLNLLTTSQEHCEKGGNPDQVIRKIVYSFEGGRLSR